jgi:hypothetical protein
MKLSVKIAGIMTVFAFALTAVTANAAFTRDLTLGSTGADVIELQTWLEAKGYLTIPTGVSKGYFGALTAGALSKYQAAAGIVPAVGYFGPITRAAIALEGTSVDVTPGSNGGTLGKGEASLEKFDLKSEDDAEEGEMKLVATAEFDVEDGDIMIDRLDLDFEFDGGSAADQDPWDNFDTITLMVDGDEIAEEDVNDEDDWLDNDGPIYTFRLSSLDYVVEAGDKAEIEIYLTSNKNVDGADEGDATWIISIEDENGIRGTDGEGIQQYVGGTDEVTFDIDTLGEGEDITIKSSSSDPDSSTLLVDENDKSDWHEVFIFKLDADENDIDLDQLVLTVTTATATYEDVVDDLYIEIDGDESDDFDVVDEDTTTADLTFDLDKDFTVDGDDNVEVVVFVKFKKQAGNFTDGSTTIKVETVSVSGEGLDDVDDSSTIVGKTHTLSTSVADVTNVKWVVTRSEDGSTGTVDLLFTLSAEEEDYTLLAADIMDTIGGSFATATGKVTDSAKGELTKVSGDATAVSGGFRVNDGEDAYFRVRYTSSTSGSNEVTIESLAGTELDDDTQLSPTLQLN